MIDAVIVGKGESAGKFPWEMLLDRPSLVCLNESIVLIPKDYPSPVTVVLQDYDPLRRLSKAAVRRRPDGVWVPTEYGAEATEFFPNWPVASFRLCDVPKASTCCIALWMIRQRAGHAQPLTVGLVGFDAYFGRTGAVYAPEIAAATGEVQNRSHDYSAVNAQIARWARETNCVLLDLAAELPVEA